MGFTINYDSVGLLSGLLLAALAIVGVVALFGILAAAKQAHEEMVEEEQDERAARGE